MLNKKFITEQRSTSTYRPNYQVIPSCSTARTGCCSDVTGTKYLARHNAARANTTFTAVTTVDEIRVWTGSRSFTAGEAGFTPSQWVTEQRCDYVNLCKLKHTILDRFINVDNINASGEIIKAHMFINDYIDKKICLSSATPTAVVGVGITGGCIDPDANNVCGVCNADCVGVIGGTDTSCCRYSEEFSLKYTYRFCDKTDGICSGGDGTTLKSGEVYQLRYGSGDVIRNVIKQLKDKLGDILIKTNRLSPYNLVDYGFFSDDNISDSDLEDFATALAIILFGSAAIDNKLKYLDGGDILEDTNTFKYKHVTIYTKGAGQLYLGNYKITSPNTAAISTRIENLTNDTTISILKNQLNWLAKNNKPISTTFPIYKMVDGEKVWSVESDMTKNIDKLQKMIAKYMPGQYVINDAGNVLRESIIGLESLLVEKPIGLGKLLE
jgi:hypothetical protein|tara:strand:+ start:7256 stop:8572 length:1317 start_codon:yes stop_codon:yes gene_type:complete